jgi:hypothetical protein
MLPANQSGGFPGTCEQTGGRTDGRADICILKLLLQTQRKVSEQFYKTELGWMFCHNYITANYKQW